MYGVLCDSAKVHTPLPSWANSSPLPAATGTHLSRVGKGWHWGNRQMPLLFQDRAPSG